MSNYQKVKLNISQGQADKIKKAIQEKSDVNIRLSHSDLEGEHILAVTKSQLNKITKAYNNGTGVTLKLSKKQLSHNSEIEGGFIGALLPLLGMLGSTLATRVVLATGLLAGVGSSAGFAMVDKIAGRDIVYLKKNGKGIDNVYLKKNGKGMKMTAAGLGVFLRPWVKPIVGEGLFVKNGKKYESVGSGLLLGPNSPFSNIPFLNLIL